MRKITLTLICIAILVTSCNLFSPSIEHSWHVTKIETAPADKESESIFTEAFVSFYDGDAASFFNKNEHDKSLGAPMYRSGTWKHDGDKLKLKLKKTTIDITFSILELTDKWLVLEIVHGPEGTVGTQLKCQPSNHYQDASFDLLDPKNNTWRTGPDKKENKEQIKQRVLSHLNYQVNYFRIVEDKSQTYFETGILQTPIGFYANGIALPNDFAIDNKWLPYFYDEEDATIGAKMLLQGINSIDEYPSDSKSYTKGYFKALTLIKEHVEK